MGEATEKREYQNIPSKYIKIYYQNTRGLQKYQGFKSKVEKTRKSKIESLKVVER